VTRTHTHEQFLHLIIGSGLLLYVFCHYVLVLFGIIVSGFVLSVLGQEIGWEEHLQYDLFGVEYDVKPPLNQTVTKPTVSKHGREQPSRLPSLYEI